MFLTHKIFSWISVLFTGLGNWPHILQYRKGPHACTQFMDSLSLVRLFWRVFLRLSIPTFVASEVCRLRGLSLPRFVASKVCHLQGLSPPRFVASKVCCFWGLSFPTFVNSDVCCSDVCRSNVCCSDVCRSEVCQCRCPIVNTCTVCPSLKLFKGISSSSD